MRRLSWRVGWLLLVVGVGASAGACGQTASGPCTLTGIGSACTLDSDCCSGYCQLYDQAAYCQAKPKVEPACIDATGFCTQNRNCCSGLCQNGACFGGSPQTSCLAQASTCIDNSSCCSNNCVYSQGVQDCLPSPVADGGLNCAMPGDGCGQASDCCFGLCGTNGTCTAPPSGGNPGPNCGQSGSFCRYGSECCSGRCVQLTSTSSCG
jgi:hypothetical protein